MNMQITLGGATPCYYYNLTLALYLGKGSDFRGTAEIKGLREEKSDSTASLGIRKPKRDYREEPVGFTISNESPISP